jgi:hypothetical protein
METTRTPTSLSERYMNTLGRPCRVAIVKGWVAFLFLATLGPPASRAQEPAPGQGEEGSRGIQIQVQTSAAMTKQQLADVLQAYVDLLRDAEPKTATAVPAAAPARAPVIATPPPVIASFAATLPEVRRASAVTISAVKARLDDVADPVGPPADYDTANGWFPATICTPLPATLLWQPPLANPYEPRFSIKHNTLNTPEFKQVTDFNLGGTLALFRCAPGDRPEEGWQLDVFAMALSRYVSLSDAAAIDYRFGLPVSYAVGRWSARLAYEHTSTHVGDEYLLKRGVPFRFALREEVALGLAYRPVDEIRVYGTYGYAFHLSSFNPDAERSRGSVGVEWSSPAPTGWNGQPFAALDLELRGFEDYTPNVTAQIGWQWIAEASRPGFRFALEYYNGRTPFGQFSDRHESWFGAGLLFDY